MGKHLGRLCCVVNSASARLFCSQSDRLIKRVACNDLSVSASSLWKTTRPYKSHLCGHHGDANIVLVMILLRQHSGEGQYYSSWDLLLMLLPLLCLSCQAARGIWLPGVGGRHDHLCVCAARLEEMSPYMFLSKVMAVTYQWWLEACRGEPGRLDKAAKVSQLIS